MKTSYEVKKMISAIEKLPSEEMIKNILEALNEYHDYVENKNVGTLIWKDQKNVDKYHGRLFLAYQKGMPLMICEFISGHGWVDMRTGFSVSPEKVAYINLPE